MHVLMSRALSGYQDRIEQRKAVPVDRDMTVGTRRPVQVRRGERESEERNERDECRPAQRPQPGASRRNVCRPDATEQPGPSCPIYLGSIRKRGAHTATHYPEHQREGVCLAGIRTIALVITLSQSSRHHRPRRRVPTSVIGLAPAPQERRLVHNLSLVAWGTLSY